ncbi:hypothetical protein Ancab_027406 [Ancistrocladus abbreviatus]
MGAACCVAARDRTIQHEPRGDASYRNVRHSPSWSFRWDNRVRVAGEETSLSWFSDGISRNDALDIKSTTGVSTNASEGGSSLENYTTGSWGKSSSANAIAGSLTASASGQSISRHVSMQAKESTESLQASYSASFKMSASAHSTPSVSMSPVSCQSQILPATSTPSTWLSQSPGHQLTQQRSDTQSSGRNSPSISSVSEERQLSSACAAGSNESTRGSYGRSSDGWSLLAFSELLSASHRERWSFGSETCSLTRDKAAKLNDRNRRSLSIDLQTCGVCSKFLTEKSACSSQKIIAGNELSVVAVLTCGHVYHAECLENITPEINKYDPACQVCAFGEKQASRLSGKMLKAEKDMKARSHKKFRNRVVDTDDSVEFDCLKGNGHEIRGPKMSSSSSLKSSSLKPFLRRHFSFGSKGAESASEIPTVKRKGLFWAKSSKV